MKVQCCCCARTRVSDTEWVMQRPTKKLELVSHTYCPECYEEQVQALRRAAWLDSPRIAVSQ